VGFSKFNCQYQINTGIVCNNIRAPKITPLCLWSSCCSIVSFLCSVLYILFVLLSDFLSHCIRVLLQFALMITPLISSKFSTDT
jgi:hypothetical protein